MAKRSKRTSICIGKAYSRHFQHLHKTSEIGQKLQNPSYPEESTVRSWYERLQATQFLMRDFSICESKKPYSFATFAVQMKHLPAGL